MSIAGATGRNGDNQDALFLCFAKWYNPGQEEASQTSDKFLEARENAMTAPAEVVELAERFHRYVDAYMRAQYNEAQVRPYT